MKTHVMKTHVMKTLKRPNNLPELDHPDVFEDLVSKDLLTLIRKRRQVYLDALRSGYWVQGNGFLVRLSKFCCMGVACDILARCIGDEERWFQWSKSFPELAFRNDVEVLNEVLNEYHWTEEVSKDFLGIYEECMAVEDQNLPVSAAAQEMNDTLKWNFKQVADRFQKFFEEEAIIKTKHSKRLPKGFNQKDFLASLPSLS